LPIYFTIFGKFCKVLGNVRKQSNKEKTMKNKQHWTEGFFSDFYQKGDNSTKGYLSGKIQTQRQRTIEEVWGVILLLRLHPWSSSMPSVCDCPCGIGRHSIELAQMGCSVLAVDSSPDQLVVGMQRAECIPSSGRPTFLLEDMRNLAFGSDFDVVINMFFSFGFFKSDKENMKVAQNFYNILKPGGKFLMHTDVNMARVRNGTYKFTEVRPLQNGETLAIMERFNPRTKRIEGIWEIGDGKHRCETKQYSVRVYENEEFVDLCKAVGFRNVRIYSDWSGSPYNEEAEMVIFVAEK